MNGTVRPRLKALARYAMAARAQAISRMPQERRVATLLAFARFLEVAAQDDFLDLLDLLIQELLARITRLGNRERIRTIRDLDAAALRLRAACQVILDPSCDDLQVRSAIFEHVPQTILATAVVVVGDLARSPDDKYYEDLLGRYSTIRRFLPLLLQTVHLDCVGAGQPVLEAWQFLKSIEGQHRPAMRQAPRGVINRSWRRVVFSQPTLTRQHQQQQALQQQHSVDQDHQDHQDQHDHEGDQVRHHGRRQLDRRYYTFCVLERLQDGLRSRDIFTSPSERWGDPHAKLLQGAAWESLRPKIYLSLDHSPTPEVELDALARQLDEAYRRMAENLPTNADVRIERIDGHDTPILTGLDKLDEPPSLQFLREQVEALLPRVDLPEAILEVQGWTGFASEFTHVSEGNARVEDLPLSICAVLMAEACNIGLEPLVRQDVPALTRARLSWVQQNYIRAETLTQANAPSQTVSPGCEMSPPICCILSANGRVLCGS